MSYSPPRQAFAVKPRIVNHVSHNLSSLINPSPTQATACGSGIMSTPAWRVPRFHKLQHAHHLGPKPSHMTKATPDAASSTHAHMARTATFRAVRRSSEHSRRYEWKHRTLVPKHGKHAVTMLLGVNLPPRMTRNDGQIDRLPPRWSVVFRIR
jgi:hypothetical protein